MATVACVPTMARTHDRLDHQRTPAQEHSRFRWTNSCASVPEKAAIGVSVTPPDGSTDIIVDEAPRLSHPTAPLADIPLPQSFRIRSPHGFRAPPAFFR